MLKIKFTYSKTDAGRKHYLNEDDVQVLLSRLPEVQEAHALTGEMDYILKVVTPDLKSLSEFVNGVLLPHESVQHVKTAIVLETLKETGSLPL